MEIIKGQSSYFEGRPHSTTYFVSLNNRIFIRSCSWRDWLEGSWSLLQMYHKDNSSNSINITAEQFINNTIPEGYTGQSWSSISNYKNNDSIPNAKELDNMFDVTFESSIKSLERDCKLNQIIK